MDLTYLNHRFLSETCLVSTYFMEGFTIPTILTPIATPHFIDERDTNPETQSLGTHVLNWRYL